VIDYIHNYQRKWKEHNMNRMNTGRIQNKFYIISQEEKDQPDVQWRDRRKMWDCNRPSGLILDKKNKKFQWLAFSDLVKSQLRVVCVVLLIPNRSRRSNMWRTRSTSSSLVSFSSSHWWSKMRLSPRGLHPCRFSSPRTYVELVSRTRRWRRWTPVHRK
jgi:hypothetical protein